MTHLRNILMICKKVPHPPMDGESIVIMRDLAMLKKAGFRVHVFCIRTKKHHLDSSGHAGLDYWDSYQDYFINTDAVFPALWPSIRHQIPVHLARFFDCVALQHIRKLIVDMDIDTILGQGLPTMVYLNRLDSGLKKIYRVHNIEYLLWKDLACRAPIGFSRLKYFLIFRSLYDYEHRALRQINTLATLSDSEADKLSEMGYKNVSVVSLSLESKPLNPYSPNAPGLLFLGSLDWKPNREGLDWFIRNIYPSIADIPLTIAGRGYYEVPSKYTHIRLVPNFKDSRELLSSHRMMVIPLLSGAGIRIKLLEGLQIGIPIVSTAKGIEGIPLDHGIVVVEDSPDKMIQLIRDLYHNLSALKRMSERSAQYYQSNFSEVYTMNRWRDILTIN